MSCLRSHVVSAPEVATCTLDGKQRAETFLPLYGSGEQDWCQKEKRNESVVCFDQSTSCFSLQRTGFTMFPWRIVMNVVNRFCLSLNRPLLFSWTALICDPAASLLRFPQTSLGRNRMTQKIDFHWVFQMQNSSLSHLIGSFSGLRTESSVTRENLRSINNEQVKWRDGRVFGRDKLVT